MKRMVIVLVMLAAAPVAAQDQAVTDKVVSTIMAEMEAGLMDDVKTMCADEWPIDFVMQEYCIGEQTTDYAEVHAYDAMGSTEKTIIWANCATEWQDDQDRQNWVMMAYCISEQDAALQRLQAR